jgi:PAS domain S-box-containing protein
VVEEITARKKVEQALRQRELDLNRAQAIGNIGSWRLDNRKNELTWSQQNHRIFGVPKGKKMTYEDFLAALHPDDRQYVDEKWKAALKGEPYDIEHRIIVDGKTKWVREKAFLEFDENGGLTGGYGITQDITDKKQILDQLRQSRDNLESRVRERTAELRQANIDLMRQAELLDLAHDTIIVHDLDGKIIFWNKGAERTYGFAKKDVLGKITHQVLKTKFTEPLLKIVTAVSTKGAWEGEMIHTAENGKKITVESRWALQRDENGKPSAILEIDRDITDRKAAQQQTEEARIYAESIIETIEEAILVLDSGLKVISANRAFYETFSKKPKNTIGKLVYELADGHWKVPEFRKLLEEILPKNTVINNYEINYPGKKGTIHLLLNAKEIFENKDDKRRILLAFHDITTHRLQEKALKELTEQLLFSEESQRQQIATALHDSIGQMLTFSKWELDKLLKDSSLRTDTRIKRLQNQINESIKQSRKLTVDLSSPTLHEFGLEAGLEELADQFSAENGVKCRLKTTKTQKPLEKRIELLLYRSVKELLHNINKHAKANNVTINVGTTKDFLEIKVTDDGRGFNISRLNSGNNKKKSFGLFSIEQRLTNVGGSFNIRSEKKKGTTVTLLAPLKIKENEKEQ